MGMGKGRHRWLCALLLAALTIGYGRAAKALQLTVQNAVYPVGDAEAVYRVVLDTLYHSLRERPPYIVLFDSAHYRVSYCEVRGCPVVPPHKSNIEAETISDFARATLVQSPMRHDLKAGRRIAFLSSRMMMKDLIDVGALLSDSVQKIYKYAEAMPFWIGFRRTFPGAWGYAVLTRVGFNESHTQALVQVHHQCGSSCGHFEDMFLERRDGTWRVAERILLPNYGQDWVDIVQSFYSPNADGRDSVVFGSLRYLGPDARRLADSRKRADSIRAFIRDSAARDQLPRRVRLTVINGYTGRPLAKANVVVHSRADSMRVPLVADSKGQLVVRDFPLGGTMLEVRCPGPRDEAQFSRRYLGDTGIYMFAAIDTSLTIRVRDIRRCWEPRKLHRIQAGWVESPAAQAAQFPDADESEIVAAATTYASAGGRVVLLNTTREHCLLSRDDCGGAQLARLENLGIIDSLTVHGFLTVADSTVLIRPGFARQLSAEMMTVDEMRYLLEEANPFGFERASVAQYEAYREPLDELLHDTIFLGAFHRLYGKSATVVSVSRVGFNPLRSRALIQVERSGEASVAPHLMLFERAGDEWKVARPGIEKEVNSGTLEGNQCAWKSIDAPTVPTSARRIRGSFRLTEVTMTPTRRVHQYALRFLEPATGLRDRTLTPQKLSLARLIQVPGEILDSTGERDNDRTVVLRTDSTRASIEFRLVRRPGGPPEKILNIWEIRGENFFGSWQPSNLDRAGSPLTAIANPGGYFCAERLR